MPDERSLDFEEMLEQEAIKEKTIFPAMPDDPPKIPAKFDTRAVIADLMAMEKKCNELVNATNALIIKTKAQNMEAVNISGKLQELGKAVKKKCEDFLEPYKKVTSSINGPKKRITDATTRAKNIVNQKILQYKKQEEIEQARQQQLIDKASKELQKDLNDQAAELGIEAPEITPIRAPMPTRVLRGDSGASVYTRSGWKVEIIKPENVERKYCLPSLKLLNQAVKMGVRTLTGCRVYKDETPVTRAG